MRLWPRRQGTSLDLLVVGLGNPGRDYARNRHNVGWLVVDELARRHGASWKSKFSGQLAEVRLDGHKVALLKPETYMNESGRSVNAAARFYKLEPDAVLVVHDEGDLEAGRLQARKVANIEATRADAVVTSNPGCIIQIAQGLAARGTRIEVLHIVELLDQAYADSPSPRGGRGQG